MNVKKSALLASMLAVTFAACAVAPAYAATKRDNAPAPAPVNVTTTTTTDSCEPLDNPFPVPVPKAPITVVLPELNWFGDLLLLIEGDVQTAPSC